MKISYRILVLVQLIIWSCTPSVSEQEEIILNEDNDAIANLKVPNNFNFETTTVVNASIEVKGLENEVLSGVKVSFFTKHPDFGGSLINSGFTNNSGILNTDILLPTYLEEIFVQVHSIGFANQTTVAISPSITLEFGGKPESEKNATKNTVKAKNSSNKRVHIADNYYYMGDFSTGSFGGKPEYLEASRDALDRTFLDDVNASLPENRPVPQYNPHYLTSGNQLDVNVTKKSDVWVTFVTEGAGYKNSLGYFVFDTNNPPSSVNEIDSIFVVLPNASLKWSGGNLRAGDKVKLGTFPPGKSISWVLFQQGWNGSGVNVNNTKFFSRSELNTIETDPTKRQHTVQLADYGRNIFLNGFEDQTRSESSDNDFNDLVFYVSANPWSGISTSKAPTLTASKDSDDDGINDDVDDYPNGEGAAKNTFTGSLAFEDLWPNQGDYDFNDLVLDYKINHILNGNNKVVKIEAEWTIKAVLATLRNGFGIQLGNLSPNSVESVTGIDLKEDYITNNGNDTEANQSKATIILFDNVFKQNRKFTTTINFKNPVSQSQLGLPPYNPFLIVHGERGKEVHLPGYKPTDLADTSLFGNGDDASNLGGSRTYKTINGLPWAISLPEPFDFPKAAIPINKAYLNFENWAISGGNLKKDWYLDMPENRDESKISN